MTHSVLFPKFSARFPAFPARTRLSLVGLALSAALLAGCTEPELVLDGDRFDPRDTAAASAAAAAAAEAGKPPTPGQEQPSKIPAREYQVLGEARGISLPAARANSDWTHRHGTASHAITHPALGSNLKQIWQRSVGKAGVRRVRITADPVISGGRIFTLDAVGEVRAHSTGGDLLWSANLVPGNERAGEGSGGGLAVEGDTLYVSTGYGNLHALDVSNGGQRWVQRLRALASGAPTVYGGLVYLTTRDGFGWAIETKTGRVRWQSEGSPTTTVTMPGSAPAVAGRAVYFPFGSSELAAVLRQSGVRLWSTTVSGVRTGRAYATVQDISGDPVIVGNTLYTGNPGGRTVAIDAVSGERLWTATEGTMGAVWPAGGSLFMVTDQAELMRLDAKTGVPIWTGSLPFYQKESLKRRKAVYAHYGPILAGGRLIVASSDGMLREMSPQSGALLRVTDMGRPAAVNPVVAGQTLYIVTDDGQLRAFR
ncbi:MAG: PQQ-like beta-propeller repeat protein [Mangrovicoccus sp.]|nr:PQQ-like beta-propeller repeat protein [Mangrovicoccus sp.]